MSSKKTTDSNIFFGCRQNDRRSQEQCYRKYFADCMQFVSAYTPDTQVALKIVNTGFMNFFIEIVDNQPVIQTISLQDIKKSIYKSLCESFQNDTDILNYIFFETHDMRGTEQTLSQLNWTARLQLLDLLHPNPQKIVKARVLEGLSNAEIARTLNLTIESVERTLTDSRSFLKQILLNPAHRADLNRNQDEYKL
jgi:DNA-directed RNA polymerase specialized sigma24 family protein